MKDYKKILEQAEALQRDLMNIDNYDEDVYQAFEDLIFNLESVIEESEEN